MECQIASTSLRDDDSWLQLNVEPGHYSGIHVGDQVHDDDEGQGGSSLYCLSVEPGVEQA